jgi:hypothetical protein
MTKWEMFVVVKDVLYQFIKIIWNFYRMVMEPKYSVVWVYEIFWPSLPIIVIICWITNE